MGTPYLHLALEQAAVLTQQQPKEVSVDLGYRGATVPAGVKVYHRKLRRGITARLKRDIRRRSAIEPVIGHMKTTVAFAETGCKAQKAMPFMPSSAVADTTCG